MIRKGMRIILYAFLLLVFAIFFISSCNQLFPPKGQFTFVNGSASIITYANIDVSGQRIEIENLKPGERVEKSFKVRGDSSFIVTVIFSSGRGIRAGNLAYVDGSFNYACTITATESEIIVSDIQRSSFY